MTPTRILGLDLGNAFGWAVIDGRGARIDSGVFRLDRRAPESFGQRLHVLANELMRLTDRDTLIAYEDVKRHDGTVAAHAYGAYWGMVALVAWRCGVTLIPVDVADVKRSATGKGNAKKEAVQMAANERWAHEFALDEADAVWIAEAARRKLGGRHSGGAI